MCGPHPPYQESDSGRVPSRALAGPGEDRRAENVVRSRVWACRRKVHPAILLLDRGQRGFPPEAEVQRQLGIHLPVVLEIAGEVGPLLADEPDRVDAAVIYPSEQERCEWVTAAVVKLGSPGKPVVFDVNVAQPAMHCRPKPL